MSESSEPSYYEIALTNRQVLVSFVVLLSCVLAAFVSGVWVGRRGSEPLTEDGSPAVAVAEVAAGDLDELEEFKFFSEEEKGRNAGAVADPPPAKPAPSGDVVSPPPPPSAAPPPAQTPPPPRATPALPSAAPAPPPPAAKVPPSSASPAVAEPGRPAEGFVIQVLSTRDEARAKRILNQLKQGSYPAFLSPVQVGSQVNYRVRIGPYPDRAPAEEAARAVNSKYKLDTWVTAASN